MEIGVLKFEFGAEDWRLFQHLLQNLIQHAEMKLSIITIPLFVTNVTKCSAGRSPPVNQRLLRS